MILDNAFAPALSTERFQALRDQFGAGVIQIVCDSDAATLTRRFSERAQAGGRHPGHGDQAVIDSHQAWLEPGNSPQPLFTHVMDLGGEVIKLDTADFNQIDYPALLQRLKSYLAPESRT